MPIFKISAHLFQDPVFKRYFGGDNLKMGRRHGHSSCARTEYDFHDRSHKFRNPELVSEQWLKGAEQDIKVAETLYLAGYYSWSAFACQQSIEKLLKAGYVRAHHKIPPHLHNLDRLASILRIHAPSELIDSILEIDQCYTSTRYPGYKNSLCDMSKDEAKDILKKTRKAYRWLRQELIY